MTELNTSKAQEIIVDLKDIDQVPLSATYQDNTIPASPVNIDLTNYAFVFRLLKGETTVKEYTIAAGALTSTYLSKTGVNHQIINMQLAWQDIQSLVTMGNQYKLLQIVTDPTGNTYVHIVYTINARRY